MSGLFTGCAPSSGKNPAEASGVRVEEQGLGLAAPALLKAEPYTQLTVEIASVAGHEPSASTLDFLATFLSARLNKPAGIKFVTNPALPATGTGGLSPTDLAEFEAAHRKEYASGSHAAVYIMFLDNHHVSDTSDARVLGLAYRSTSIVIFEDTIRQEADPIDRALIQKTVLTHEFGHLLGLVNFGTSMANGLDHYDNGHNAGHCSNTDCLMNYAVNTERLLTYFEGRVPALDSACINDLRAAGGK